MMRNGSNRGVSASAKRRVFDVHDQGPSLRAIKTCPLVIRHDSILGGESLPMSLQPYYRSVNLNAIARWFNFPSMLGYVIRL